MAGVYRIDYVRALHTTLGKKIWVVFADNAETSSFVQTTTGTL
jgi:hypothetical protein